MYKVRHFFLLFIILGCSSCSILQWRSSDQKIKERFLAAEIPTEISYFKIDSLDLNIRLQAVKSDTASHTILFLHGSPSSLSAWNKYLLNDSLRQRANLYAVDRPGYGYSNFGNEITSIELQAEIMSALITNYQLENVIVVGASYGGPVAARIAVINKNIKGVVMISPAIDPQLEKHIKGVKWTQYWLTGWLVPTGYRVAGDEKTTHAAELAKIEDGWANVSVPIIHIHGNKDELVPYGNVHYSQKQFSNITIITTPNTGHEISWKRPELILPHLFSLMDTIQK